MPHYLQAFRRRISPGLPGYEVKVPLGRIAQWDRPTSKPAELACGNEICIVQHRTTDIFRHIFRREAIVAGRPEFDRSKVILNCGLKLDLLPSFLGAPNRLA